MARIVQSETFLEGGWGMAKASEIRLQLERLLADQISLSEFSNWFVPYSWNVYRDGNSDAQELVEAVDDQLIQPHQDPRELRNALRIIAFSRATAANMRVSDLVSLQNASIVEIFEVNLNVGIEIQPQAVPGRSLRRLDTHQSSTSPLREFQAIA